MFIDGWRREGGYRKDVGAQKMACCEQGTDKVAQELREGTEQSRLKA